MTSSDPKHPGDENYDATMIRPAESVPSTPDLTKNDAGESPSGQGIGGDPNAATTVHSTAQPDPYAAPSAYPPPADPYAQPNPYAAAADPYGAQQNPYAAPSDPYANPYAAALPQYPSQQPYGQQPGYPAYPGQGSPGYPAPGYGHPAGSNGLAIAALVCGIASYPLACGYGIGIATAVAALIMGVIAMKQVKTSGQNGHGMALAGAILGGVYIALFIIAIVILVAVAASGGFDTGYSLLTPMS